MYCTLRLASPTARRLDAAATVHTQRAVVLRDDWRTRYKVLRSDKTSARNGYPGTRYIPGYRSIPVCISWNREIGESLSLEFTYRVICSILSCKVSAYAWLRLPVTFTWYWSTWEFQQLLLLQKDCSLKLAKLSADDGPIWNRQQLTGSFFCRRTWHCWLLSDS